MVNCLFVLLFIVRRNVFFILEYIFFFFFESFIYIFFIIILGRFKILFFVFFNINGDKNILESFIIFFLLLVLVKFLILLYISLVFGCISLNCVYILLIEFLMGVLLRIIK